MEQIKIYIPKEGMTESELIVRGCIYNLIVEISETYYTLDVNTILVLKQEFDKEMQLYGWYNAEPNIVLVRETNFIEVRLTIINLFREKYFDRIKSVTKEYIENLDYGELMEI